VIQDGWNGVIFDQLGAKKIAKNGPALIDGAATGLYAEFAVSTYR